MVTVQGKFDHLLRGMHFVDQCGKLRHFLARLHLCRHVGTYLTALEHWEKEYRDRPSRYPRLFE